MLTSVVLPEEVPPEIPRVVLQSSDKTLRLEAGPARMNCHWNRPKDGESPDLSIVVARCCEVQEQYVRETSVRVGRLGLVVTRICKVENPAQMLVRRFCNAESQKESFNRSANFEIHNHKEYTPQREGLAFKINSWVRCKTANLQGDGGPAILVEQDLNTLAAEIEQRRFDPEQIRQFSQAAAAEAEDIFRKYFPE